jgi:hypothetical protein
VVQFEESRDERYDYLYPPEELKPIAASLKEMTKKVEEEPTIRQVKKVIAATNNHYKGQAAVNAIDLKRLLKIKRQPCSGGAGKGIPATAEITSNRSASAFCSWLLRIPNAELGTESSVFRLTRIEGSQSPTKTEVSMRSR